MLHCDNEIIRLLPGITERRDPGKDDEETYIGLALKGELKHGHCFYCIVKMDVIEKL